MFCKTQEILVEICSIQIKYWKQEVRIFKLQFLGPPDLCGNPSLVTLCLFVRNLFQTSSARDDLHLHTSYGTAHAHMHTTWVTI